MSTHILKLKQQVGDKSRRLPLSWRAPSWKQPRGCLGIFPAVIRLPTGMGFAWMVGITVECNTHSLASFTEQSCWQRGSLMTRTARSEPPRNAHLHLPSLQSVTFASASKPTEGSSASVRSQEATGGPLSGDR